MRRNGIYAEPSRYVRALKLMVPSWKGSDSVLLGIAHSVCFSFVLTSSTIYIHKRCGLILWPSNRRRHYCIPKRHSLNAAKPKTLTISMYQTSVLIFEVELCALVGFEWSAVGLCTLSRLGRRLLRRSLHYTHSCAFLASERKLFSLQPTITLSCSIIRQPIQQMYTQNHNQQSNRHDDQQGESEPTQNHR